MNHPLHYVNNPVSRKKIVQLHRIYVVSAIYVLSLLLCTKMY